MESFHFLRSVQILFLDYYIFKDRINGIESNQDYLMSITSDYAISLRSPKIDV